MVSVKSKSKAILSIFIIIFLCSKGSLNANPQNMSEDKIPNVIIVTLAGLQNSESIDEPYHQYIPNLWNKIFKEGVLYTNLINQSIDFHMPSVIALNAGIAYSFYYNKLTAPAIFQYVRKKYALPANKVWFIGNWFKAQGCCITDEYPNETCVTQMSVSMDILIPPEIKKFLTKQELLFLEKLPKTREQKLYNFPQWNSVEEVHYPLFKKVIKEFKPKLVHYFMADVDSGHHAAFCGYIISLKRSDERIYEIWQMIQSDPFYKDKTYLIVCVDHGRDQYYMNHSGNPFTDSYPVWMYIYGPNIKKGVIINRSIYHVDIFATIANIMNVETHPNKGRVLTDCFQTRDDSAR